MPWATNPNQPVHVLVDEVSKACQALQAQVAALPLADRDRECLTATLHRLETGLDALQMAVKTPQREGLDMLQAILEAIPVGVFITDDQNRYRILNQVAAAMIGKPPGEIMGQSEGMLNLAPAPPFQEQTQAVIDSQRLAFLAEQRLTHPTQGDRWYQTWLSPFFNADNALIGVIGSCMDITDRKRMEEDLRASLQEKDLLLAEVHHRVKNNLQIISSLLELQANRTLDQAAQDALLAGQNRVIAMALIHETLYHSGSLAQINFGQYVQHLASSLCRAYSGDTALSLILEVEPNLDIPSDLAISLGLILNELVTNALKHGFSWQKTGTLSIRCHTLDPPQYQLSVSHDGHQLPGDFDLAQSSSMGLKLVRLLTQRIHGHLTMQSQPHTTFTLEFSLGHVINSG